MLVDDWGIETGQALNRQEPIVLRHIGHFDLAVADQPGEIGQVGLGRGEPVFVLTGTEDHSIFEEEPGVLTPDCVLGSTNVTRSDVPGEHSGQEVGRIRSGDPILEERRSVEDRYRVSGGEILGGGGVLVALGHQVAGPVVPPVGGIDWRQAFVKRCLSHQYRQ